MCDQHLEKTVHLGFNDERVHPGNHICFIYSDEAARKKLTQQFLQQAFKEDEGVFYAANDGSVDDISSYFKTLGIDVESVLKAGQLSLDDSKGFYYPNGSFSAEEMWQRLRDGYDTTLEKGFKGWRGTAKMSWALDNVPGAEELIAYEQGVNRELIKRPFTAICQYDANVFDAEQLMEVLKVHPYMIANGKVVENPHFEAESK